MIYHYWISKLVKAFIHRHRYHKRLFPTRRTSKQKSHELSIPKEVTTHMLEFHKKKMRCHYWKNESWEFQEKRMRWNYCKNDKAEITKRLCPVRHVTCTYAWLKREILFWSIICSFPSRLHRLFNTFSKIDYSCVYCLGFFIINVLSSM